MFRGTLASQRERPPAVIPVVLRLLVRCVFPSFGNSDALVLAVDVCFMRSFFVLEGTCLRRLFFAAGGVVWGAARGGGR